MEKKIQHLSNIRVKALEKKKWMKEITEKDNKLRDIKSKITHCDGWIMHRNINDNNGGGNLKQI